MNRKRIPVLVLFFTFAFISTLPMTVHAGDVNIHGFISQGFLKNSKYEYPIEKADDGTFQYNEMGIVFTSQVSDRLRLGLQFLSRDFGEEGNNEINVDWCYGDYAWRNYLGLRAGLIKVPMGLYNEARDVDVLRTGIFLPGSVYSEFYREALNDVKGVGIYGILPGSIAYQAVYGVGTVSVDGGLTKLLAGRAGGVPIRASARDVTAAAVQWETPVSGFRLGGSFLRVNPEIIATSPLLGQVTFDFKELFVTTASAEYIIGDLVLSAERIWVQNKFNVKPTTLSIRYYPVGYYGSVSYRFTEWFSTGLCYSDWFLDKEKKGDVNNNLRDWAMTFRFDVNSYWTIKLEGHRFRGFYGIKAPASAANGDDPEYYLFGAKITFTF